MTLARNYRQKQFLSRRKSEKDGGDLDSIAPRSSICRNCRWLSLRFAAEYQYGGIRNGVSSVIRISWWIKSIGGSGPVSSNTAACRSWVSLKWASHL